MNDKQTELDQARQQLKSTRSILDMMHDNTDPAALKQLEKQWCGPILERIQELEAEAQHATNATIHAGER